MKNLIVILLLSLAISSCDSDSSDAFSESSSTSTGGSLASITIVGDHLYALNSTSIIPVDISDLNNPEVRDLVTIGTGLETIFPYNGRLFIGSASALFVYDLSDPTRPEFLSQFTHATGCDPVVAKGDYAYVTLRDGFSCNNPFQINVLEVVNVADPRNTFSTAQYNLSNPRGLGIGCNNKLFVCDGDAGLLQFDLSDPSSPVLERTYEEYFANDVLIQNDLLILTGNDGVFQFRCTDEGLQLLSKLPITI